MPRLSLKRNEIDLLFGLVTNRLISLSDDIAQAEDDGDDAEPMREWQVQFDQLADKLAKAKR